MDSWMFGLVDNAFVIFLTLGIAAVVAGVVLSARQERKRQALYTAFAANHGLTYQPKVDDEMYKQFGNDSPFGRGHSRSATHVLSGTLNGAPVLGFTYIYKETTSSGKSSSTTTYRWQICALWLPTALPTMSIEDEGIFGGRLADALGFDDVALESDEFNHKFRYQAADDRYGSALMPNRMMELMLAGQTGVTRINGRILYNAMSQRPQPEDITARWDFLAAVAALIPAWVLKDYGSDDHLRWPCPRHASGCCPRPFRGHPYRYAGCYCM